MLILWKKPADEGYLTTKPFPLKVLRVTRSDDRLRYECINEKLNAREMLNSSELLSYCKQNRGDLVTLLLLYVNPVTNEVMEEEYDVPCLSVINSVYDVEFIFAAGQLPIAKLYFDM